MKPEDFLRTFFAPPNQVLYEKLDTYEDLGNLRKRAQCLLADPRRSTVLPFIYRDPKNKLWHLNYALAFSEREFRQLGSDLQAFVGPTYAGFSMHRANLDPAVPLQRAVFDFTSGWAYRFFSPTDPQLSRLFVSSLELMDRVASHAHTRQYDFQRPTGRILRDFYVALEVRDRVKAETLLQELRDLGRLDALNITFLRIQLLSQLGTPEDLLRLPTLPDVIRVRRPPLVTQALVAAVYDTYISAYEVGGDVSGAITKFRETVLPEYGSLYAPQFTTTSPETLKSAMLFAVTSVPQKPELRDRVLAAMSEFPPHQSWLKEIASQGFPTPPERPTARDPLDFADKAIATEDYPTAFGVLRSMGVSRGIVERLIVTAFELQTLEAYEVARSTYQQLQQADRDRLASTRARRIMVDAVLRCGIPETELDHTSPLPQDWLEWAMTLAEEPDRKGWYKVAEKGALEWPLSRLLDEHDQLSEFDMLISRLQSNSELQFALPHLVHSLRTTWDRLPDQIAPLIRTIMGIFALNKECTSSDLRLWSELADSALQMGLSEATYVEIVEEANLLWQTYKAPDLIDWALDVLDTLVMHPCRSAAIRASFLSAVFAGFSLFPQRLTEAQLKFFGQLSKECGQSALAQTLQPKESEASIYSDIYSKLKRKTVAIYTLTEKAGERLRRLLEEWFDGVRVVVSNDKVGNPSLQKIAENADIFLVSTGSATHSATTFIRQNRPREKTTILVSAKGTSGMLAALLTHLETI